MPVFEMKCRQCGEITDIFVQNEKHMTGEVCPRCGSGDIERLMSASYISMGSAQAAKGIRAPRCGNSSPCCGAAQPCDKPPCDS